MDIDSLPQPSEDVEVFSHRMAIGIVLRQDVINECWRSIDGYMNYQVSNVGRVRNVTTGRILKQCVYNRGYYVVGLTKDNVTKTHTVHKLVAHEFIPQPDTNTQLVVDHIDRNKLNNQITNLRWVTQQQNNMNSTIRTGTSSQYKGVTLSKKANKWRAYIMLNRKLIHLGYFDTEEDAARAYNAKAIELFSEFANLNPVDQ